MRIDIRNRPVGWNDEQLNWIAEKLKRYGPGLLIEFGSLRGGWSMFAAQFAQLVIGIEISTKDVAIAWQRVRRANIGNVVFVPCDGLEFALLLPAIQPDWVAIDMDHVKAHTLFILEQCDAGGVKWVSVHDCEEGQSDRAAVEEFVSCSPNWLCEIQHGVAFLRRCEDEG